MSDSERDNTMKIEALQNTLTSMQARQDLIDMCIQRMLKGGEQYGPFQWRDRISTDELCNYLREEISDTINYSILLGLKGNSSVYLNAIIELAIAQWALLRWSSEEWQHQKNSV
ncbi:MAG TPA: hypothetical protein PKI14_19700 [Fervidobacterium sp.]|nr:hypothetical protein [Fervidobacterium sp.]